jgi:hypothetical protein
MSRSPVNHQRIFGASGIAAQEKQKHAREEEATLQAPDPESK